MMHVHRVQIMFSTQTDWVSRLIRFFTWSMFSHVDVILPPGQMLIGATASSGVRVIDIKKQKRKASKWSIYEFECIDEKMFYHLVSSEGAKPYDFNGIIGMLFRKNWQRDDRWFCSELVAWASAKAGCPILTGQYHRITPGALLKSPILKLIESSE